MREANAIMFFAWWLRLVSGEIVPNIAVTADGSIGTRWISEKGLNIDCQKLFYFEQNQNMCERMAGISLHLAQIGSALGVNFAHLTLDQ